MIAFAILAVLLVATAVATITARQPVHSVIGLLAHFATLAVVYLTLQAEFLAVMQIVVYSGAILILFVFVIALLSSGVRPFPTGPDRLRRIAPLAVVAAAIPLAVIAAAALRYTLAAQPSTGRTGDAGVFGSVADFGAALFTTHLLPFEVTAFVLMIAVIGVVLIAGDTETVGGRRKKRQREAIVKETVLR